MKCNYSMSNTQKVNENGRRKLTIFTVAFLIWCLWGKPTFSGEHGGIQFGTFITESDIWNKDSLGVEFSPEQALELELDDETVLFYHDERSWEAFVVVLQHRQKQILWKIDWLGTSGHVPDPILAAGNFNANQAPDLLFCYSTDRGIGKSAEHWTQYLYLFFDNEQTTEQPISLAVVDIFLCDPDEEKLSSCKPSKDRLESLVMLLPAWGKKLSKMSFEHFEQEGLPKNIIIQLHVLEEQIFADENGFFEALELLIGKECTVEYYDEIVKYLEPEPCSIYVWSRREREYAGEASYQIVHYRVDGQELLVIEENDGNYQTTSEQLRAVLQHRQEYEEAPVPILLNFLKKSPNYLCEENEWFRYLEGWE